MTSRRITYVDGLLAVTTDWLTGTFKWALVETGWIPDETADLYVDDISGFEFTDGSYARQTMTAPAVTVQNPAATGDPGYIQYGCADPDFGIMSDGDIATSLVLYFEVTTDADSPIVAVYPVGYTADGTAAVFTVSANGAVTASTVCPAGF